MSPKIAHLTTVHKPRDNRIFNKECTALAASGFDITLIARGAGSEDVNGVHQHELPETRGRLQRLVGGGWNAWRALNSVRPKSVHVHDPELIPLALVWCRLNKAGFIYDSHEDLIGQIDGKDYLSGPARVLARLYARALMAIVDRFADAVVAATPVIARRFRRQQAHVVRNYPWLKDFPRVEQRDEVPGRVVYIGGITETRQVDSMLGTIAAVPESSMVLAGPTDAFAEKVIADITAEGRIDYIGPVPPTRIPEILASGAVGFVFLQPLPNYRESLPTKLFEYMAAGIPFVASDFPYFQELLEEYQAGLFVDTTSVDAPAEALRTLLADDQLRAEMGERGRRAIEEVFNFEADVPQLVEATNQSLRSCR